MRARKFNPILQAHVAANVCAQIRADMADGTIPRNVRSFADLHDHVDANEYLLAGDTPPELLEADDHALANAVIETVDGLLASGAVRP